MRAVFPARGRWTACLVAVAVLLSSWHTPAASDPLPSRVDTALVISVDVSSSVNERRYRLQLEGIASALEDPGVIETILNGPQGNIMIAVVAWSNKAKLAVPWTLVTNEKDAAELAQNIRSIPQEEGRFTCLGGMMRYVASKVVLRLPTRAAKTIVDISGDGPDNCNPDGNVLKIWRDDLVSAGVTINGLPILEGKTAENLDTWYREHVIGGTSAFILPADGYEDFARAFRQKFIIEVSQFLPKHKSFRRHGASPLSKRMSQQ